MTAEIMKDIKKKIYEHKIYDQVFSLIGVILTFMVLMVLFVLLIDLMRNGVPRLSVSFFTSYPSRFANRAGILSAWVGTILVMTVTAIAAVPIGVAAGIYLEEYARKNWITNLIEINITNLAGVPSIIYGLMALGIFVYQLELGQSILTAGLTLSLLILPIVIVSTREALRTIPIGIREAAQAAGATKWQVVKDHLVPYSAGGVFTGIIIALSRAIGETAPLLTIGALTFIAFLPDSPFMGEFPYISFDWLLSPFTVMPIQMFNWVSRPQIDFHKNAAAAGCVLIFMSIGMNALAMYLRYKYRKKIQW